MEDSEENRRRIFISYSRKDTEFATRLATDLRSHDVQVWFDQLDIPASARWDDEIESALRVTTTTLVILSPDSVSSENVRDEINMALSDKDRIIPVLYRTCTVPMRIGRHQYVDFTGNYDTALTRLVAECKRSPTQRGVSAAQAVQATAVQQPAQQQPAPQQPAPQQPAPQQPAHSVSPVSASARPAGYRFQAKHGLIAGGVVALIAIIAIAASGDDKGGGTFASLRDKAIDELKVDGLALTDVRCPEDTEIFHGQSIECTAQVEGSPVKIKLTGTASQDGAAVDKVESEVQGAIKAADLLDSVTQHYGEGASVSCDRGWIVLRSDPPAHCTATSGSNSYTIEVFASNSTDGDPFSIAFPNEAPAQEQAQQPNAQQPGERPARRARTRAEQPGTDDTAYAPTTGATEDYRPDNTEVGTEAPPSAEPTTEPTEAAQ